MYYVNVDSRTDQQLEFCGYRLAVDGIAFKLYEDPHGNEHIVSNDPPRYLYVDDLNDAECLRADYVLNIPN